MESSAIFREPVLDASPVLLAVEWRPPVLELRIDLVPLEWEPASLPVLRVEATGPDISPEVVETLRGGVGRTCSDGAGWSEPLSTPELLLYLDFRADPIEIRVSGIRGELETYVPLIQQGRGADLLL